MTTIEHPLARMAWNITPMAKSVKPWSVSAAVLLCALGWAGGVPAQGVRPTLTVWLMPNEPAAVVDPKADIDREIDRFNQGFSPAAVVVLNTSDNNLRQQLLRWNPEFALPDWPTIKGQERSLRTLANFAGKHNVTVKVLIINWGQAFDELRRTLGTNKERRDRPRPDVVQIGSTWVAYFVASKDLLPPATRDRAGGLAWRYLPKTGAATLPYIQDVRLLFFWKRLPYEPPAAEPFSMNAGCWEEIIDSLKRSAQAGKTGPLLPPLALPIGFGANLLHDYVPLIWAGGGAFLEEGSTQVDLTSAAAMKVPLLLSQEAVQKDDPAAPYRLIAFPRLNHGDILFHHFLMGRYRAVIEPTAFLRRWKEDFEKLQSAELGKFSAERNFWDYCGLAVPPAPFKGGSDLMVVQGTPNPDLAFHLARFLASDREGMQLLAGRGHLPSQSGDRSFGIPNLLDAIGTPGPLREEIERLILQGIAQGREYPHLESFAPDLESEEVLEAMQRVWRQMSEVDQNGNGAEHQVGTAAAEAQFAINFRIDRWTRISYFLWLYRLPTAVGGLALVIGLLLSYWLNARKRIKQEQMRLREEQEKNRLLEEVRTVRGFAASALQLVDNMHHNLSRKPDVLASATEKEKVKALMIRAGLRGWRRGSDDSNWQTGEVEQIIWRAILIAIDYLYDPRLFTEWERSGAACPQTFLRERALIRKAPVWAEGEGPFYVEIHGCESSQVQMPLMLEHILICLLTNAFKASRVQDDLWEKPDYFKPVRIDYDRVTDTLSLANEVAPDHPGLSPVLCDVLNTSQTVEEFEKRIHDLLRGPVRDWPGIGLVEAYCMARQCFGGLSVDATSPRVSLRLRGSEKGKR